MTSQTSTRQPFMVNLQVQRQHTTEAITVTFHETGYLQEMTQLVRDAINKLRTDHPVMTIYTVAIWTDPNAAISAISIDTFENSTHKIRAENEYNQKHFDRYMAEGDLESANLFRPNLGRNCNPADFALRNLVEVRHAAFDQGWEETSQGGCWEFLEPALAHVATIALHEFADVPHHPNAELGINSRRDWYDRTWPLN